MSSGHLRHYTAIPGLPPPAGAYSQAVRWGGLVFTAGLGPHHPETGDIPVGIEAQTHQVLDNLEALLSSCGGRLSDLVQVRVYLAELGRDFTSYNVTYAERMPQPYPVRTTVGAGLLGFLIEIDAVCQPRDRVGLDATGTTPS